MPGAPPAHDAERGRYPAAARLRARRDFRRVMDQGRKQVGRRVVVWVLETPPDVTRSRLGLSVGRRVGDSPARNRVKRVLREAFRRLAPGWPTPVDVVVLARPGAPPTSLGRALSALRRLGPDPGRPPP